ncbi:RNA polymerase sigma factor [Pedobacter nutrimenti]|uniref:RNA polymerase sigma factor n=1 Tax=Pedobacter nutrimenti TaxID=1241337 RepID=UPI00292D4B5D|nr:sigma-70 family RNA polymerase sigma factor [Pedobacter nutrimenti]
MVKYDELSDQELAILLQQGDERALRALYDRHIKQLHYFILRGAKSHALTQDIVHEAFIKIWENRLVLNPNQCTKAYLYTIAKRHMLNLLKRAQHESAILEEIKRNTIPIGSCTDMEMDFKESSAIFNEAINHLPTQMQKVFLSCKIHGLSYKQTADNLGITEGTVNNQMVKALKSLKQFLTAKNVINLILLYSLRK